MLILLWYIQVVYIQVVYIQVVYILDIDKNLWVSETTNAQPNRLMV